jgi:hypothetical protein
MDNESTFKVILAAISSFFGYIVIGIRRNTAKHDSHDNKLNEHDKKLAIIDEQMKHVLSKLEEVIGLGTELKNTNKVILNALVRRRSDK